MSEETKRKISESKKGKFFDGREFDSGIISIAETLAQCELGFDCGPNNHLLMLTCASGRYPCFDSAIDMQRYLIAENNPNFEEEWEYAVALSKVVAQAIRNRDVDKFIPPALLNDENFQ